ncbi:MAG: hypothetical protein MJ175_09955, partial [Clostridia bacterium]|nr:hypothetical protein [Clostridia bacterium]
LDPASYTSVPALRTDGIAALFSDVIPWIYKNDLIFGSFRPMWTTDEEGRKRAENVFRTLPERTFHQGVDHFAPDYGRILSKGIPGIRADILTSMEQHQGEDDRVTYLSMMLKTWDGFAKMIASYASAARALTGAEGYDTERLLTGAERCEALLKRAPIHFDEALQLVWFCHTAFLYEQRYAMALGRIDQYLYPYYQADMDAGVLTDARCEELIQNVFMKIYERQAYLHGDDVVNICIGGTGRDRKTCINALSYCVLHAVRDCNIPGPNLSARITADTPDDFLDECLKVIGTGLGYPALMNDAVNLAALRSYGYDEEDVLDYCMVGCIENFLPGKQPPWGDGRFDTPRFFEYLFNRGKGIASDTVGIDTGDVSEISSMDEFMKRFEEQLKLGAKAYVEEYSRYGYLPKPEDSISPFISIFCGECIERGLDINLGGPKYPSAHGAVLMGVGTVSDSLAAIEKTVFIDHTATLSEIGDAMRCNFEGMEDLRRKLIDAPKYGNNDDFVDKYAVWFVDFLSKEFRKYRMANGGAVYVAMAANTSNIYAGRGIAATPNGRLRGEPLSDAASPTYGVDVNGVTSTVLSVTKPDYCKVACGTVINQKFMPSVFADGKREKLLALLRVYFSRGGQEMQINATSREILQDAMDHPENYGGLVVRVSGFSAYYVTLGREVQSDILHRTQQAI